MTQMKRTYSCRADAKHQRFVGKQQLSCEYLVRFDENGIVSERKLDSVIDDLTDIRDDIVLCEVCNTAIRKPRQPIPFIPDAGMVLLCNYAGFQEPEMTKLRPVVVLTRRAAFSRTCLVAAISTSVPNNSRTVSVELRPAAYTWLEKTSFVKCAMLDSVRPGRLFLLRDLVSGANLDSRKTALSTADLVAVRNGIARVVA